MDAAILRGTPLRGIRPPPPRAGGGDNTRSVSTGSVASVRCVSAFPRGCPFREPAQGLHIEKALRETRFEIPVDIQYRLQCAAVPGFDLTKMLSETDAFFNRAEELAMLQGLLGATPTAVVLLTGPPSCGKSGACSAEWTVTRAT